MIRIVLLGRTGNNLFQYAMGRTLAERHGVPLVLDGSWFNAEGWSEVSNFLKLPLQAKVIRPISLASRALRNFTGKHFWEYRGVPIVRESVEDQTFDERLLEAPADCMLFGYFQSPLYFQKIAAPLRLELKMLLGGAVKVPQTLRLELSKQTSVAVHVRRRDYLDLKAFQVCDAAYYQESMRQMRARVPGARFFIFSDDLDWCRATFTAADQQVVDSGISAANPIHDLHLMSSASHHIIANSSYSWWAAWLGDNSAQQVIMPDRWYASGSIAPIEEKRLPHWTIV